MTERKFECRICFDPDDESHVRHVLRRELPSLKWEQGDGSWDKIRVWGVSPEAHVRIYRYEPPGPFSMTITIFSAGSENTEEAYLALRDEVIRALGARLWKPLEAQPVSLIQPFPEAYDFESDLGQMDILSLLEDAQHWHWQSDGPSLRGSIRFRVAGETPKWKGQLRIVGEGPRYTITVGRWPDEYGVLTTCDEVHETVQTTVLPAIGAQNVRPAQVRITYPPTNAELPFIVGVIADLSGKRETPLPRRLRDRQFVEIDRSRFDEFMAGIGPRLAFRAGPLDIELRFQTLEDFEPHAIARQVEPLRQLLEQRKAVPERASAIDAALSSQLDLILNAYEFRELEASWRGLHFLVSRTQTSATLRIKVLNASRKDVLRDLQRAVEFDQSGLFHLVDHPAFAAPHPAPFGLLVSDLAFGIHQEEIEMLERLSCIAAAIHAPLIAAASPGMFACESFEEVAKLYAPSGCFLSPASAKWRSFSNSEDARYIGLTFPRIRLRSAYGKNGRQTKGCDFEETAGPLWGSAAWAFASRVTDAFARHHWCADLQGELTLDEGGAASPVECVLSGDAEKFLDLGLIPFLPVSGADDRVTFPRAESAFLRQRRVALQERGSRPMTLGDLRSADLPYRFAVSRFAHHLQALVSNHPGDFTSPEDCAQTLNQWINQYVRTSEPPGEVPVRPLRQASIDVHQSGPNFPRAVMYAYPAYQLQGLSQAIRISVTLPLGKIGAAPPLAEVPKNWVEEARTLSQAGRHEEALTAIDQALAINSQDGTAWRQKVMILERLKRGDEKLAAIEAGLRSNSRDSWLWQKQAEAMATLGRWEESLAAAEKGLAIDSRVSLAWHQKVFALGKLQRWDEQLAACDAGLQVDPRDAWLWHHKTELLEKRDRWEEALEAAERALEFNRDPNDWHYKHHKAAALDRLGRLDESLEIYEQVIAANPLYQEAWTGKAEVLDRMGRWDDALAAYDKLIEMAPTVEAYRASREALRKRIAFVKAAELTPPRVRITYETEVGDQIETIELPFVVGVLADLSGSPEEPLPRLDDRKFVQIDRDNFDAVLASLRPRLKLRVGKPESEITLMFRSLADFSPDGVALQLLRLSELLAARDGLRRIVAELIANEKFEILFERTLNSTEALAKVLTELQAIKERQGLLPGAGAEALLQAVGVPHFREDPGPAAAWLIDCFDQLSRGTSGDCESIAKARLAAVDDAISREMDQVLHHPDFQRLEATWRSLRYLVQNSVRTEIRILNVSKQELSRDLQASASPEASAIFRKIYEEPYCTPAGFPVSALIGDYYFDHSEPDLKLLTAIARVASEAHMPFLAAAETKIFNRKSLRKLRDPAAIFVTQSAGWSEFRESQEARFAALAMPRILLRLPYGQESVERFSYDERLTMHEDYLWGNAAFAVAVRIAQSFERFGWFAKIPGLVYGYDFVDGSEYGRELPRPVEIEVNDGLNLLARSGYITLDSDNRTDSVAIHAVPSGASDPVSGNLPCMLVLGRFAHTLVWRLRDGLQFGGYWSRDAKQVETWLNRWLNEYVPNGDLADSVERPLKSASVELTIRKGIPETFYAVLRLQPQFQFPDVVKSLSLELVLTYGEKERLRRSGWARFGLHESIRELSDRVEVYKLAKARFGLYEIIRELGRSHADIVFHAVDAVEGRQVALRVLKLEASWTADESADYRRWFDQQVQAKVALQHPNLVTFLNWGIDHFHDKFEIDGSPFLVTVFVKGETLDEVLRKRQKLPLDEALRILRPVADALDYLHSKDAIHHDIKPGKIMMQPDGHVILMDCGLATVLHLADVSPMIVGNLSYMAPELLQSGVPTTGSDRWAFSVLSYYILAGGLPFADPPAIMRSEPASITGSIGLNRALAKALAKQPESRYPTCSAFVAALQTSQDVSAKCDRIPLLRGDHGSLWRGGIPSFCNLNRAQLFLAISSQLQPDFMRIAEDLEGIRLQLERALPGLGFSMIKNPPDELPFIPNTNWCRLDQHGPWWERIRKARTIFIRMPEIEVSAIEMVMLLAGSRPESIPFSEETPGIWTCALPAVDVSQCIALLEVSANVGAEELSTVFPSQATVSSVPLFLELLGKHGIPGLTIRHPAPLPSSRQMRSDCCYFQLVQVGPNWEAIKKHQAIAISVPKSIRVHRLNLLIDEVWREEMQ